MKKNDWILCCESLPDTGKVEETIDFADNSRHVFAESDDVLVWFKCEDGDEGYGIGRYNRALVGYDADWWDGKTYCGSEIFDDKGKYSNCSVIAWMVIPEPPEVKDGDK